jgi:hypothetical protein
MPLAMSGRPTPNKRNQKYTIMLVLHAVPYTLNAQPYEQQVCERVDDFGRIYRCIIVLLLRHQLVFTCGGVGNEPSHQFIVEVTGCQNPSCARDGG